MPRLRRLFADGLPERLARLRQGLDGVDSDVAAGRPPSPDHLETLFLAAHSLKGTAPGFGAEELGRTAGELSLLARAWSSETVPDPAQLAQARDLLARVARGCDDITARTDADAQGAAD